MVDAGLARAQRRWSLTAPEPVSETPTSTIWKVLCADGTPAALKLLKPYGADEMRGAAYLDWCGGDGAVRLIAAADRAMLLEWLPGRTLAAEAAGRDDDATEILADVIAVLHRPRIGVAAGLLPLADRMAPLLDARPAAWPMPQRAAAGRAAALARELLADGPALPLHGDLHHDNVLASRRGWVAIDPKGVSGDPAYDLANCFRNPHDAPDTARDPDRIDRMAARFAVRLGHPRRRILAWAAAHAALSMIWNRAAGGSVEFDLAMLNRLLLALDRTPQTARGGK